jgi:hypothetical protein
MQPAREQLRACSWKEIESFEDRVSVFQKEVEGKLLENLNSLASAEGVDDLPIETGK